jgi:DNA-binding MarR family transcriptional regulator
MSEALKKELKQTRPFSGLAETAHLSVLVTAERIKANESGIFRAKDLTAPQYNVLRILRGAGTDGISCTEVSGRMITRDSDITRMLDRLEARGLIARHRKSDDRRVIKAVITEAGLAMLDDLDVPLEVFHRSQMAGLSDDDLKAMIILLDKVRSNIRDKGETYERNY